jgi:uncharacterized Zn finger protein (UPF0148 family)
MKKTSFKMKNCPYCGCALKETSYGRLWCPNCGIVEDVEADKDDKGSYIG